MVINNSGHRYILASILQFEEVCQETGMYS